MRDLKPADAIAPGYLLLCLLLGGASAAGAAANALIQVVAVALLAGFALRPPAGRSLLGTKSLAWLVAATVALVLYQLIPLPGAIWSHLPGRGDIAAGYRLLQMPNPALSLSLDVDRTIASGLGLLPPLAMTVATIHASGRARLLCFLTVVGAAGLSIIVGALQLGGGEQSPFYFYAITNRTSAVGFFANSNHLALLLLTALPCVAALATRDQASSHRRDANGRRMALLVVGLFLCFGLLLNRSLAGLSLLVPVLFGCFVLWRRNRQKPLPRWQIGVGAAIAAALLAIAYAGPLGGRFMEKAFSVKDPVTRRTTNTLTLKAAVDHLPFGTGLGTFVQIYPRYEDPGTISTTYANHAHDEYVEIALETGLPGLALLCAWLLWVMRRTREVWAGQTGPGGLARAASVMIAVVLIHSLVEYPARTGAIAALMGMAVGLLVVPTSRSATRSGSARHARIG